MLQYISAYSAGDIIGYLDNKPLVIALYGIFLSLGRTAYRMKIDFIYLNSFKYKMELLLSEWNPYVYIKFLGDKVMKVYQFESDSQNEKFYNNCARALKLAVLIPQYVPKIYGITKTDTSITLSMERIKGITLREYIDKKEDNLSHVCIIINSLIEGLNALHENGYGHFDLHDKNIIVKDDYTVVLIDFDDSRITTDFRFDLEKLKFLIAHLLFPQIPIIATSYTFGIIKNYTEKDVVGYETNPELATALYTILGKFKTDTFFGN